jgi:hypothetical protein
LNYRQEWNTFERIWNHNVAVSTAHSQGNLTPTYYGYETCMEQTSYLNGQQLHTIRYPNSNWESPQKN